MTLTDSSFCIVFGIASQTSSTKLMHQNLLMANLPCEEGWQQSEEQKAWANQLFYRSTTTDNQKISENIVFTQFRLRSGVSGVNHHDTHFLAIYAQCIDNIADGCAFFKVPVLKFEPGLAKKAKSLIVTKKFPTCRVRNPRKLPFLHR